MVAQHLLLHVQQAFPHVTPDTIDDLVKAAFPACTKVNGRKNGLSFYHGLIARPDVSRSLDSVLYVSKYMS